jgi:hypothetical protein
MIKQFPLFLVAAVIINSNKIASPEDTPVLETL